MMIINIMYLLGGVLIGFIASLLLAYYFIFKGYKGYKS